MKRKKQIVRLVLLAIFCAISVVLQAIANNFSIGGYPIALALVPIAISAILLGPSGGAIVGFVWGAFILLIDPSCAVFFEYSVIGTLILVLSKGTLAGFASGVICKMLRNKNMYLAMVLAAILCPIINSLTFRIGEVIFFLPMLGNSAGAIIISLFGVSFVLEVGISAILSPAICRICMLGDKELNLGVFNYTKDEDIVKEEDINKENKTYKFD